MSAPKHTKTPWLLESGTFDFDQHIGKRSAAGLYCCDCRLTLCRGGESSIHFQSGWYDACPECKKVYVDESTGLKRGPVAVELGFAKPEETAPTGVNGAASFSWAQRPEEVRQRCEKHLHTACIRDEYGREMTGGEFLRMLRANCPIEFTHSIGVHFS